MKKQPKKVKKAKIKKNIKLPAKLIKYLEKHGVNHKILEHKTVYTAYDAANTLKKKLDEIAKSLLVKADKDYYLVILPADHNLDFDKLKKFISKLKNKDVKVVAIPGEKIMEGALKLKKEALSAFGRLHNLEVIMEKKMGNAKKAVFASGSYNHSVEMAVKDFINLENAALASIGVKKKVALIKKK
ncbi:MAG: YbaK/EbsC family protein [Patescibacteria group bacterium]|nr:YbaK/EbsC family protein [Patescibacteria group bacterium]MDD4610489.1 YbaK/EbsC family protein [Patescibacteria group bacterium]